MAGFTDSVRGRRLLVEFRCGRCGRTHVEPYSVQAESTEGNLQSFKPPSGWRNDSFDTPMLCETCHKLFREFMKNP